MSYGGLYKQSPYETTPMQDWLYGTWSKEKLQQFSFYHRFPGLGDYMDYLLDLRNDDYYLKNNQMTYSDIFDPRKLSQTSSGTRLVNSFFRLSRNLDDLYR